MNILLVDDDQSILDVIKHLLIKDKHIVTTAENGSLAIDLIDKNKNFDIVISDVCMPEADGMKLLSHVKLKRPELEVILMTGFANILETKEAYKMGAKAFLAKPFKMEELNAILSSLNLKQTPPKISAESFSEKAFESDEIFCRIAIKHFISGKTIDYPIFINLSENKYVKIAHKGEDINLDRIRAYQSKGVDFLYMKSDDFSQYVGLNLNLARSMKNNNKVSKDKKMQFTADANIVMLENLFVNGVNQTAFNYAKEIMEMTIELLVQNSETYNLLDALKSYGEPLYSHSLGVGLYSVMIAKQIGWNANSTLCKISMAGTFHDIGLKEVDKSIALKSRTELSFEELKELESHPIKSKKILSSVPSIPSEVIQAIVQHHESFDGRGFPYKIARNQIIPMASLIAVADEFCELVITHNPSQALTAKEAIERLSLTHSATLDSKFMDGLKKIFS